MNQNQNSSDEKNDRGVTGFYRAFGLWTGVGTQLAVAVGLLAYGGSVLDQKLDTEPLFLIGGAALGMAAGFLNLFRMLQWDQKQRQKQDGDRRDE